MNYQYEKLLDDTDIYIKDKFSLFLGAKNLKLENRGVHSWSTYSGTHKKFIVGCIRGSVG